MILLIFASALCGQASPRTTAADKALSVAIRTTYEANRATFPRGSLRYRLAEGSASSLDQVHRGHWTRIADTVATLIYSGGRARYECIFSAEVMVKIKSWIDDTSYSVPFTSNRVITDGSQAMMDQYDVAKDGKTPIHTVTMEKGTRMYDHTVFSPLGIGGPPKADFQLGNDLERVAQENPGCVLKFRGDEMIDGHTTRHLEMAWPAEGRWPAGRREYWVDLEADATPRRIFEHADGQDYGTEFHLEDLRKVEGHGWLPFKQTMFFGDMKKGGKVRTIEVLSVDFDSQPTDADFVLKFDTPTICFNGGADLRYPPKTVWDLKNLPRVGDSGVTKMNLQQPKVLPLTKAGVREPRDWSTPMAWLGGLLLATSVVLGYRRLRRA